MKHLKRYKIFESNESEIENYLRDIFIELEDDMYDVSIVSLSWPNGVKYKKISIFKRKPFWLADIFDVVITADSYLNENGWTIGCIVLKKFDTNVGILNNDDIEKLKDPKLLRKEVNMINKVEIMIKRKD